MKFLSSFKIAFTVIILALFATSCEEKENNTNTIEDIVLENPNLSTFRSALLVTDLTQTLKSKEPYTVFAPSNEAFAAYLVYSNYGTLDKVPVNLLKQLLLNHIVLGNVKLTDFTTGYLKTLATSSISKNNTMSLYVDSSSGVKLNGVSKVTTPDIVASNGAIHIVDAVIDFPFITTHIKINPKLSSLLDAITSNADAAFVNRLSLPNFYKKDAQEFFVAINSTTVFAPTNTAFSELNTELAPGGIAGVSKANLNNILKYHTLVDYVAADEKLKLVGNLLASELTEGQKIPTFYTTTQTPDLLTVQLTGGAKIKDVKNRISTIETTDIQCWNGVIHVVNKVLLPNL